tara:strand:- start:158 stop:514 length:357 start_codon:yes stop_codon:yes gene_type:complete
MKFLNDLKILLFSIKVGEDEYGNQYYEDKKTYDGKRKKRFVRYNGIVESSKVPPMWHAWLHHVENKKPKKNRKSYEWKKSHLPNLTGTIYANRPEGSLFKSGERQKSHADYESWNPNN